jgi:hypothetical protein
MKESEIQTRIRRALVKFCTLFRVNVGTGWTGYRVQEFDHPKTVHVFPGDVVIRKARRFSTGLPEGTSDLLGFTLDGRILAIECKSAKGKPSEAQVKFLEAIRAAGGIAGVCRSVDDALELVK